MRMDKSILMLRIKLTTPVLIIHSFKLTSEKISIMPCDRNKWEEYLEQTYDTALSIMLNKLKSLYERDLSSEKSKKRRRIREVVDLHLTKLIRILISPNVTEELDISKELVPCNSHLISIIRSALKRIA